MNRKHAYQANSRVPQPMLLMRQEPAKKTTNVETEVLIPVFHALIITAAWTLPTLLTAGILLWLTQTRWYYIVAALVVPCVVFPITISRYIREQRSLLWKQEEYQPPPDQQPATREPTFTVELLKRRDRGQLQGMDYLDFGIGESQALDFIRSVLANAPITEAYWTGRGKPFSKRDFITMRDMLIARGLLEWRNPTAHAQGSVLTDKGRQIFEQITSQ